MVTRTSTLLLIFILLLAGCTTPTPAPTVTSTSLPVPTESSGDDFGHAQHPIDSCAPGGHLSRAAHGHPLPSRRAK